STAIGELISRSDIFDMFFLYDQTPAFSISNQTEWVIDTVKAGNENIEALLRSMVKPFDLEKGNLYRFCLVETYQGGTILFMDFHHIIMDGISIFNFTENIISFITSKQTVDNEVDYKDFVLWNEEYLKTVDLKSKENFWLKHLGDEIPVLKLPYDGIRPPILDWRGKKLEFKIDRNKTLNLRSLAAKYECSLFVVMLSIYQLLLSKYSGQSSLITGIPVSGRNHPDLLSLYGMFVNNIAIKADLTEDISFSDYLLRNKVIVRSALDNQDYPFDFLIEKLEMKADPGRNPVFDTMFNYQNIGSMNFRTETLSIEKFFFDPGFSRFDVSMEIFDSEEDHLIYAIEYSDCLFQESTIKRFSEHFELLISSILDRPDKKISELSLLRKSDYSSQIQEFNNTQTKPVPETTIYQVFDKMVKKSPSANAVIAGTDILTYEELDLKARVLAEKLAEMGVNPQNNTVVGILLDKSIDMIVSIMGVLHAGGCYLPIDKESPEERIRYYLDDSNCKLLLSSSELLTEIELLKEANAGKLSVQLMLVDELEHDTANVPENPENAITSDKLCYIIYTSGTTGKPKGVMIAHESLLNYANWAAGTYVNKQLANSALFTNIAFDLTVTSIFLPLITGGAIHIYSDEQDIAIKKAITSNEVNIIKLTPSHLRLIVELTSDNSLLMNANKTFIVGGEALYTDLAKKISAIFEGHVKIFNEYGPTEATVGCMSYQFDAEDASITVPIGGPIDNTQVYVLDRFQQAVPVGIEGELYISGDGISRGYLNKKQLTEEKFLKSPFEEGRIMYRTNDLVKRLPSGNLLFLGRSDKQVKINGYRIELAEIVHAIRQIEGIADAVAFVRSLSEKHDVLVAFYTSTSDTFRQKLTSAMIKSILADFLPAYMIPNKLLHIESFPLTKNGKIDYEVLQVPDEKQNYSDPENELEVSILEVWQNVFGRKDLSVGDNFFDLGGDSIIAVQIASKLFERKITINARDILKYHTIRNIAQEAELVESNEYNQGIAEGSRAFTPIEKWFFSQEFKNPDFYNQSVLLQFLEPIDKSLVVKTIRTLIEHHDALRTNYNPGEGTCFYNNEVLLADFDIQIVEL
ncbi:MAG: amino acid adenylation domain-containing protein, partial [Cyclobacteriaceae bacterium]